MSINVFIDEKSLITEINAKFGTNKSIKEHLLDNMKLSKPTALLILAGKPVSPATFVKMAAILQCPIEKLVDRKRLAMSQDAADYTKLVHGWYIDHDRMKEGQLTWHHEFVNFEPIKTKEGCLLSFSGTIKHDNDLTFRFTADLLDSHMMAMQCFPIKPDRLCFSATFTRTLQIDDSDVLCGAWSGINHFGTLCFYRFLLSANPIEVARLGDFAKADPMRLDLFGRASMTDPDEAKPSKHGGLATGSE